MFMLRPLSETTLTVGLIAVYVRVGGRVDSAPVLSFLSVVDFVISGLSKGLKILDLRAIQRSVVVVHAHPAV